ncbi:MAG: hypothetical protein ABJC13_15910 [Acidobacteriota bacterium]
MTQQEYEHQKRLLDEQLQAGIALLEAAHRQQRRALDLVWMTMAEGDIAPGFPVPALLAAAPAREREAPRPAEKRVRRLPGALQAEVEAALEKLPERFDRNDLLALLPGEPDRSSLFRVLQEMADAGRLRVELRGEGRLPTRYYNPQAPAAEPPD